MLLGVNAAILRTDCFTKKKILVNICFRPITDGNLQIGRSQYLDHTTLILWCFRKHWLSAAVSSVFNEQYRKLYISCPYTCYEFSAAINSTRSMSPNRSNLALLFLIFLIIFTLT